MGSKTVNPSTPLVGSTVVTSVDTLGTTSSIVITATTAQSALDLSKLVVVFENYSSTASCTVSLNAGSRFSGIGVGAGATVTIATATSVVFGGKAFESARYLNSTAGTVTFTILTAATCYVRAHLLP